MAADLNLADELLKHEGNKGWRVDLFPNINDQFVCSSCNNVCRDAVELSCEEEEHDDDEIQLYCNDCLKVILNENGNKCPITNHDNPSYSPSRMSRKCVMKAQALCPNSKQYKAIKYNKNNNGLLVDTSDAKEGIDDNIQNDNVQGCDFNGTLKELIQSHIEECVKVHEIPQNVQTKLLQSLQVDIASLKQENISQNESIKQLHQNNSELNKTLKLQNVKNEKLENMLLNMQQKLEESMLQKKSLEQLRQNVDALNEALELHRVKNEKLEKTALNMQQTLENNIIQKKLIEQLQKDNNSLNEVITLQTDRIEKLEKIALSTKQQRDIEEKQNDDIADIVNYKDVFNKKWTISSKMRKINDYKIEICQKGGYSAVNSSAKMNTNLLNLDAKKIIWKSTIVGNEFSSGLNVIGVVSNRSQNYEKTAWDGLKDAYGITTDHRTIKGEGYISSTNEGFHWQSGDVIQIEFDKMDKTLNFTKCKSNESYTMQLPTDNAQITGWFPAVSLKTSQSTFEIL